MFTRIPHRPLRRTWVQRVLHPHIAHPSIKSVCHDSSHGLSPATRAKGQRKPRASPSVLGHTLGLRQPSFLATWFITPKQSMSLATLAVASHNQYFYTPFSGVFALSTWATPCGPRPVHTGKCDKLSPSPLICPCHQFTAGLTSHATIPTQPRCQQSPCSRGSIVCASAVSIAVDQPCVYQMLGVCISRPLPVSCQLITCTQSPSPQRNHPISA